VLLRNVPFLWCCQYSSKKVISGRSHNASRGPGWSTTWEGSMRILVGCSPTWQGSARILHPSAPGGRPRGWVRCGLHPNPSGGRPRGWVRCVPCIGAPLVRAHVARFCTRCTELALVCAHEQDFREELGSICTELPHVRGFSRGTCPSVRARARFPCTLRASGLGARTQVGRAPARRSQNLA
jgi:hypothetical protein